MLESHLAAIAMIAFSCACTGAELIVHDGEKIQAAVARARSGDTIKVLPGSYHETVFIDKDNVHLLGVVKSGQWAVLDGRGELNDGILVAGHGVTIERMHVRRYKGNGIMIQGGNNFRIVRNQVEGKSFYGIFPQFGQNGLVAWNTVWGVEDAGIYAGMCQNVDIRANETFGNVIGIETENSHDMLVEGNFVHDNSSGVILTLIQGLPVKSAANTIVRNNFIVGNNTDNFAAPGSITAGIPAGTGVLIFAADATTLEGNVIRDNDSVGVMVTDQAFLPGPPDPKQDPRPDDHRVLDNVFINNGAKPRGVIGSMLAAVQQSRGPDLMTTGKGRNNCLVNRESITTLGAESWLPCDPSATSEATASQRLAAPVQSAELTGVQKGRLTYLAVCTGCHSYSTRLLGPPMVTVQALYKGRPAELARWIASPARTRPGYPEMPPQNYLPEEVRLAVAKYILEDLRP